jgi:hypothetical protein
LSFPLATFLHLNVQAGIRYDLVDATKSIDIPQFRSQHRHGFGSKFGHTLQPFGFRIFDDQLLHLFFQVLQIDQGMLQLIAQDPQAGGTRWNGKATAH